MTFGRILINGERGANAQATGGRCIECLIEVMYHLSANRIKVPSFSDSTSALENEPEGDEHQGVEAVEEDCECDLCRLVCTIISISELVAREYVVFGLHAIHFF